uniref:Cytochrome P450 n=1 Tax=Picea sitchensis TaxID=3332 RepID=D5AA14_PICSI|nr:unknown [Picea sitchensis]
MAIDETSKGMASSTDRLTARMSWQGHNNWFNMAFHNLLQTVPGTLTAAAIGVLTVAFLFFWILQKRRWNSCRSPPGPYPWPIIGNLHQLRLPAHRSLGDLAQKYGPIMFLRLGSVPTVVVSSSETAKQFLKTHDSIFTGRPLMAAGKYLGYNYKVIAMAPCGDHWRQMRKICVSELLSAKRIDSFKDVREEEVSAMISSIWEESQRGTRAVNMSKAISALANNIIWRILASRKFSDNDLGDNSKGPKDLVSEISATLGGFNIGDFIPYLDWLDLQGIKGRMKKAGRRFDAFAEKLIDDHIDHRRAAKTLNGQGDAEAEPVKDLVDVLLDMAEADKSETKITREKIKAIVLDIFGGGAAGTFTTIEWAMSELLRHPHTMKRLQEEIESVIGKHLKVNESDLVSMKYLQCVVKETLRLYPAGPLTLPRESVEAVTIAGYYIPKKTLLMVNLWAIGRDPNLWGADASEFKPERFMKEQYIDLIGQSDFKMLPFGAGRRGCPGYPMAIPIVELALAQLLHVFDWRVEGDPSQLDMKEACGASMPRQVPLSSSPSLRLPTCYCA